MQFKEELALRAAQINEMLEMYLPKEEGLHRTLLEAANYSMRAGGKRLRPMMMHLAYCLFDKDAGAQMPADAPAVLRSFMAAMEMIHTHSLVHDDLPAMDNDMYRRGKKTTHAVFGEAMAILAGDALLNLAYETASGGALAACVQAGAEKDRQAERSLRALQILSTCTGIGGMIGGQSLDVQLDGQPLDEQQMLFIYRHKTGDLIRGSLMIGAALAGADESGIEQIGQVGEGIGMAFQIRDDMLDVAGDEKLLGKPVGSDERNNKTTWVTIYGMEAAGRAVHTYTEKAIALLDEIPGEKSFLRALLLSLVDRAY